MLGTPRVRTGGRCPALSSPHLPPGGAPPSPVKDATPPTALPTAGQGRRRWAPLCRAEGSSKGGPNSGGWSSEARKTRAPAPRTPRTRQTPPELLLTQEWGRTLGLSLSLFLSLSPLTSSTAPAPPPTNTEPAATSQVGSAWRCTFPGSAPDSWPAKPSLGRSRELVSQRSRPELSAGAQERHPVTHSGTSAVCGALVGSDLQAPHLCCPLWVVLFCIGQDGAGLLLGTLRQNPRLSHPAAHVPHWARARHHGDPVGKSHCTPPSPRPQASSAASGTPSEPRAEGIGLPAGRTQAKQCLPPNQIYHQVRGPSDSSQVPSTGEAQPGMGPRVAPNP